MSVVDLILGAELIGVLVGTFLWGVAVVQAFNFFFSSAKNVLRLKVLVSTVCALESLHMIILWIWLYNITVTHYGQPEALASVPWTFAAALQCGNAVAVLVQAFYTYRIYVVSRRWWLAVPLWLLELFEAGVASTIVAFSSQASSYIDYKEKHGFMTYLCLGAYFVIDFSNTAILCGYLKALDTGIAQTSRIINKLAIYSLETGAIITIATLSTLALWVVNPSAGLWVTAIVIQSKLYSNALFGALNSRQKMRSTLNSSVNLNSVPVALSRHCPSRGQQIGHGRGTGNIPLEPLEFMKRVDVETHFDESMTAPGQATTHDVERGPKNSPTTPSAMDEQQMSYVNHRGIYATTSISGVSIR